MQVYTYYGHAGDICISNGDLKLNTVPKHTLYVSRSGCGIIAMVDQTFGILLIDPQLQVSMKDPSNPTHKRTIEQFLGGEIEVHTDDMVESIYNPLGLYRNTPTSFTIFLSGMRTSDSFLNFPQSSGRLLYPFQIFRAKDRVPKTVLLQSFDGAIYPTKKMVEQIFSKESYSYEELERIGQQLRIPVHTLMLRYPGIHYNLLCRSIHESCMKAALKRRIYSAYTFDTQLDTLRRTLLYEKKVKDLEAFLYSLPNSFFETIDIASLQQLQTELPPERKHYITYILQKISTKNTTRKSTCPPKQETKNRGTCKKPRPYPIKKLREWLHRKIPWMKI